MTEWEADCLEYRDRILTGVEAHWCAEWDDLPIDETCPEWPCGCVRLWVYFAMDIQAQLDKLLADNPDLQKYVTKLWYIPDGDTAPADVTHTLRLGSQSSIERHLTIGLVATPQFAVILETLLALAATQP